MKVKVIRKENIEINQAPLYKKEIIQELEVESYLFFGIIKTTTIFRKVHGTIFKYKNGKYKNAYCHYFHNYLEISNYFKLPVNN